MPFGVKMELMETEDTIEHLMQYVMHIQTPRYAARKLGDSTFTEEEINSVRENYFVRSNSLREQLHYRLHGPRFPRDMDAASVGETNN